MENNNKNLENELENNEIQNEEDFDIVEAMNENKKAKKSKSKSKFNIKLKKDGKKSKKQKLIRNQALFKRGSYSLIITAAVIIGVVIFNVLFSALAKRINLEYDMSIDKVNSISEENIEFIKKVDKKINVYVCADEESYVGGYMDYYAQMNHSATGGADYYTQTVKLVNKYEDFNSKINVEFLDPDSKRFTEIAQQHSNTPLYYGDILVTCSSSGTERFKKIGFTDIYEITEADDYYAYLGYSSGSTVTGNNIETALTSAVAYVTSTEDKKIAILTGHSSKNYTSEYIKILEQNNYKVDTITDSVITSISDEYDAVVIAAPTKDFLGEEIIVLSEFLDNDKQLDKGLIYFADATAPYLPNFSDFLTEWGIVVEEGVLFETDEGYHMPDQKTNLISMPTGSDNITSDLNYCLTDYNVPFSIGFEQKGKITVTPLMSTSAGTIAAPLGVSSEWKDYDKYTQKSFPTVIQAESFTYNDDNEEIRSYVMAFSSIEFIYSQYLNHSDVSNINIAFSASERAANAHNVGITFDTKFITTEDFAAQVTESSVNVLETIFVTIIPLAIIIVGIYIYIRRRNA